MGIYGGLRLVGLLAGIAALAGASPAGAAVSIDREIPVAIGGPFRPYTVAPDGTIWMAQRNDANGAGGTITQYDQQGQVLDTFTTANNGFHPNAAAWMNNRFYAVVPSGTPKIWSWATGTADDTDPGFVFNDFETGNRFGSNATSIRTELGGMMAFGVSNKVATVGLADTDSSPFYPQEVMGTGVTTLTDNWETCRVLGPGTPPPCGTQNGLGGPGPGQFDNATDIAPDGANGFYVTEADGDAVSHVSIQTVAGEVVIDPDFVFGSSGSAAGQLDRPVSIRRVPATGNLVISSPDNGRIDEFNAAGGYVRSFGWGVLTGANQFETCGIGIGACQKGLPFATQPRSYYTQLDIVGGELYAGTPLVGGGAGNIQVISLDGVGPGEKSVALKAKPRRVKKGKRTKLTATLSPCPATEGEPVRFERLKNGSFRAIGSLKTADADCKATHVQRVKKKTKFRARSEATGDFGAAASKVVTVKLK